MHLDTFWHIWTCLDPFGQGLDKCWQGLEEIGRCKEEFGEVWRSLKKFWNRFLLRLLCLLLNYRNMEWPNQWILATWYLWFDIWVLKHWVYIQNKYFWFDSTFISDLPWLLKTDTVCNDVIYMSLVLLKCVSDSFCSNWDPSIQKVLHSALCSILTILLPS